MNKIDNNENIDEVWKRNSFNQIKQEINNKIDPSQPDIDPIQTLLIVNQTLRTNIKLGLTIYKQLNNFYHNHINEILKSKLHDSSNGTTKSNKSQKTAK